MLSREAKVFIRMFMRTYFVGGCINTRGMQNIGLSYAMDPGLRLLYKDEDALQKARKHYLRIYNTHPCWTPLLVAIFFYLENKIVKGILPAKTLSQMKSTIAYTLSAVGDSFFGASLYVFWSLSTMVLLSMQWYWAAFFWAFAWVFILEGFKLYTFWRGIRQGITFLSRLKSFDLINWGTRLKIINTALVLVLWLRFWPGPLTPVSWLSGGTLLIAGAWCASFSYRVRDVFVYILGIGLLAMPWIMEFFGENVFLLPQ